jgi:hypothetical protein
VVVTGIGCGLGFNVGFFAIETYVHRCGWLVASFQGPRGLFQTTEHLHSLLPDCFICTETSKHRSKLMIGGILDARENAAALRVVD